MIYDTIANGPDDHEKIRTLFYSTRATSQVSIGQSECESDSKASECSFANASLGINTVECHTQRAAGSRLHWFNSDQAALFERS